jgi:hypothetical protein
MASPDYQSSRTFASLKVLKERFQGHLTTSQYLQIYDECINNAIIPIIVNTRMFDTFLGGLLGWQEKNFRRKISFLPRKEIPALIITFLLSQTAEARIAAYKALFLDRGARTEFIRIFLSQTEEYRRACDCQLLSPVKGMSQISYCLYVRQSVEESLCSSRSLVSTCREAELWLNHAQEFKGLIVEKYVRLCLSTAQKDYVHYFNCKVNLDDQIQTYLIAASRAIDKCDYKQGALTSHVQKWLLSARSLMSKNRGRHVDEVELEQLPDNTEVMEDARNGVGTSEYELSTISKENQNLISVLAKLADPIGAARAFLNIPEVLNRGEKFILTGALHE